MSHKQPEEEISLKGDEPKIIIWDPRTMVEKKPAKMDRCLNMRGAIVAVAGMNAWIRTNTMPRKTPSVSRAMTRRSFHCWMSVSGRDEIGGTGSRRRREKGGKTYGKG